MMCSNHINQNWGIITNFGLALLFLVGLDCGKIAGDIQYNVFIRISCDHFNLSLRGGVTKESKHLMKNNLFGERV